MWTTHQVAKTWQKTNLIKIYWSFWKAQKVKQNIIPEHINDEQSEQKSSLT